ncbi:unnamed protein product [Brassica oleracea]|uniref:(rape) hypothetical protein n=1 Tax=Brassica napus TaxID=3708 RepID=A0A816IGQ3_BRANA|nr:unnamed protein product [Brassica napus]
MLKLSRTHSRGVLCRYIPSYFILFSCENGRTLHSIIASRSRKCFVQQNWSKR